MAAIGSVWASGSWVSSGGWAAGTWADVGGGGTITALDDDLTTAFAKFCATLPAGTGMNERIRAFANSAYGTSYTDIMSVLPRVLRDIRG